MFVKQGARMAVIGAVVGLVVAAGLTKYIQTLLFGIGHLDIYTFAGTALVMLGVALIASYIPARRASKVDPLIALRAD